MTRKVMCGQLIHLRDTGSCFKLSGMALRSAVAPRCFHREKLKGGCEKVCGMLGST